MHGTHASPMGHILRAILIRWRSLPAERKALCEGRLAPSPAQLVWPCERQRTLPWQLLIPNLAPWHRSLSAKLQLRDWKARDVDSDRLRHPRLCLRGHEVSYRTFRV